VSFERLVHGAFAVDQGVDGCIRIERGDLRQNVLATSMGDQPIVY
jgi:hypothetical protein